MPGSSERGSAGGESGFPPARQQASSVSTSTGCAAGGIPDVHPHLRGAGPCIPRLCGCHRGKLSYGSCWHAGIPDRPGAWPGPLGHPVCVALLHGWRRRQFSASCRWRVCRAQRRFVSSPKGGQACGRRRAPSQSAHRHASHCHANVPALFSKEGLRLHSAPVDSSVAPIQ